MAYSNWGAFVWKNGELRKDCCDTGLDIGELHIGGHAVINCEELIFEFYKSYFPTICEKQCDGTYKKWEEDSFIRSFGIKNIYGIECNMRSLPEDRDNHIIEDLYYSFRTDTVIDFEYKGYKIEFFGDRFEIGALNTTTITTPNGDVWYCVYGMSFGNGGYEKRKVSKCNNKYLWFDEERKEYYYDCKNIDKKMLKAYQKDNNKKDWYWIRRSFKDAIKDVFTLNYHGFKWEIQNIIDKLSE